MVTRHDLLDEETGEVNLGALKALARREAMATYGAITPRSLRSSLREVSGLLPELQAAWRERHGLPIPTTTITPFGNVPDGVRRSAF